MIKTVIKQNSQACIKFERPSLLIKQNNQRGYLFVVLEGVEKLVFPFRFRQPRLLKPILGEYEADIF